MLVTSILLFAALSRAELIDRFRAPVISQVDGLVQVRAECGAAMRREFQLPVAGFAAGICRRLYAADKLRERHFDPAGMVIVLGDLTNCVTNVVVRTEKRDEASRRLKILVPAPGSADREALALAIVKGYCLAVHREEADDRRARERYLASDPEMKLREDYRALAEWYEGKRGAEDDSRFLRLQRAVLQPGFATEHDVSVFSSRLFLFPEFLDQPFAGRYDSLSFRDAIALAETDPAIRAAARRKIQEAVLFSGGRGERMNAAGLAYAAFLRDLAAGEKSGRELALELDIADMILKGVLDENKENDNRLDR